MEALAGVQGLSGMEGAAGRDEQRFVTFDFSGANDGSGAAGQLFSLAFRLSDSNSST